MATPVRIGLVADVQYADLDDREGARFRSSLDRLAGALERFVAAGVERVVQLGDVIEGHDDVERSVADLERVLATFAASGLPVEHVVGNHCLSVPRAELHERLGIAAARRSFSVGAWRFVILDSMELSLRGGDPDAARAWLAAHPLAEYPCANEWNGGFGGAQLDWLEVQLATAARRGERVVVVSHHPVHPEAARPKYPAWDHEEARARLAELPRPAAWFAGHDHAGGRAVADRVEYRTLPGVVAAEGGERPTLILELHADRLVLR